jgi:hypothetical protein
MMNQGVTGSGRHDLDVWHVRLAGGETRALSLDDLDAAFQAGWVDERTPVLPAGAIRWATLGEIAGLEAVPAAPISSVPNSIAPLALDNFGLDAIPADVPIDMSTPLDAESDAELQALRPRRGRKILGVMTTLVVVAGIGFAGFRATPAIQRALASRGGGHAAAVATEAKPAAPPVVAAPVPVPAPAPAPVPAPSPSPVIPTMSAASLPTAVVTQEEKKAAAEAEKKAAAEARKAKRAPQKRTK